MVNGSCDVQVYGEGLGCGMLRTEWALFKACSGRMLLRDARDDVIKYVVHLECFLTSVRGGAMYK